MKHYEEVRVELEFRGTSGAFVVTDFRLSYADAYVQRVADEGLLRQPCKGARKGNSTIWRGEAL